MYATVFLRISVFCLKPKLLSQRLWAKTGEKFGMRRFFAVPLHRQKDRTTKKLLVS